VGDANTMSSGGPEVVGKWRRGRERVDEDGERNDEDDDETRKENRRKDDDNDDNDNEGTETQGEQRKL
jgi:hypothetical protein